MKVYRELFLFALLCVCLPGRTQPEGFTPVNDTSFISQKVAQVAAQTNTINTDFIQEKQLAFLNEKIVSKGNLKFQKPDKLRLEYTSPFNYLLVMNAGQLFIKNEKSETRMNLEASKMFSEINNLILNSVQGKVLNMPDMSASFFENNSTILIRLLPTQDELKKYITSIELYISKQDYTVTDFKVNELSDDYTLIKFVNKKINEELPAGCFNTQ